MEIVNVSFLLIFLSKEYVLYKCIVENLMGFDEVIYIIFR